MSRQVEFSARGLADFEQAVDWYADNAGVVVASRFSAEVERGKALIAGMPFIGRVRIELLPINYRFIGLHSFPYFLIYDSGTDPLVVVRLIHAARDLPTALSDLGD